MTIPGVKKSDRQRKLEDLMASLPAVSTREAMEELSKIDPVIWTMYHRRLRGNPMIFDQARHLTAEALKKTRAKFKTNKDYDHHVKLVQTRHRPFMLEPLRDDHPHKAYKKGRQIGISELSLTEALCFLDQHPGTKWIYTFPRDAQLQDFSTTRIKVALEENNRMKALVGTPNQVYTKKIGESYLILRSAWESNLGEGIDGDGVTFDEKDRMKPGIDEAFKESLSSSQYRWIRDVSTPTLPGRGVDHTWQKSDQRVWMVKCVKCSMWQNITYPESFRQMIDVPIGCKELPKGAYEYSCKKARCRGMLDRVNGRWVAGRPSVKNFRGYHMPQTIANWISCTEIMQKKIDSKFIQLWMNYVLAETSMGDSIMLTEHDFEQANAGHDFIWRRTPDWSLISVGIDWGHKNWVHVIGQNTNGRTYQMNIAMFEDSKTTELEGVRQVHAFIDQLEPDIIVADAGYGKDRNAYLLKRYGEGRFFACNYNPAEKGGRTFTPVWSNDRVLVDRTMSLKVFARAIKERELGLCDRTLPFVQLFEDHAKALAPIKEENEDGEIVEVIASSGDDHLFHAGLYSWLGMDRLTSSGRFSFDFV